MKSIYCFFLACTYVFSPGILIAQESKGIIFGIVQSKKGDLPPGINVMLQGTDKGAATDEDGRYEIKAIDPGHYIVLVSGIGFLPINQDIQVNAGQTLHLDFILEEDTRLLKEVVVAGEKTTTQKLEDSGFNVDVIETQEMKNQSVPVNRLLDRVAGVRVRQSGGMGSDFDYTLDGMSGNSIRFLVDGIPIDYFGSVYNVNNVPASQIERIEIYKGVVPVYLAADALGGAVNIVTISKPDNFLEASYSVGSFNTHQFSAQGQWADSVTGFTARLSAFYNYSDNNYKVWGKTVTYYDESTNYRPVEFTKENPATRFNDDYRAALLKADVGFTNKKWADQFFVGFLSSDVDQGVQHGQTMAYVFGDMRYQERFYMPTLTWSKNNILDRLSVKLFSSYAITEGITIDTGRCNYNWRGDVVSVDLDGGERTNAKSIFNLKDKGLIASITGTYRLHDNFELVLNYLLKNISRSGSDEFAAWHTVPFTEPQSLQNTFTGLSLNSYFLDRRLKTETFVKHYGYKASVTETFSTVENPNGVREVDNTQNNIGGGMASSFEMARKIRIKLSAERAIRLPDTREALGNGVNIRNSPNIKPEKSFNVNLGFSLGPYRLYDAHMFRYTIAGFYRDTDDLLYPSQSGGRGEITYENINKILGKGGEFEFIYDYRSKLRFVYNITYMDTRNNEAVSPTGVRNVFYKDRLRNAPYLMSNATLGYTLRNTIQKNATIYLYCAAGYVHEYYLAWPSAGNKGSKSVIPTQFVTDIGLSYTVPSEILSLSFDASNVLNAQVYDNFLLQKPGRAFAVKLSFRMNKL